MTWPISQGQLVGLGPGSQGQELVAHADAKDRLLCCLQNLRRGNMWESHENMEESHENMQESHENMAEFHENMDESHENIQESHENMQESH